MSASHPNNVPVEQLKQVFAERCDAVVCSGIGQVALGANESAFVSFLDLEDAFSLEVITSFSDDYGQEVYVIKEVTVDTDLRVQTVIDVEKDSDPVHFTITTSPELATFQALADDLKNHNQTMHDHLTDVLDAAELQTFHAMQDVGPEELLDYLSILDRMLVASSEASDVSDGQN